MEVHNEGRRRQSGILGKLVAPKKGTMFVSSSTGNPNFTLPRLHGKTNSNFGHKAIWLSMYVMG